MNGQDCLLVYKKNYNIQRFVLHIQAIKLAASDINVLCVKKHKILHDY